MRALIYPRIHTFVSYVHNRAIGASFTRNIIKKGFNVPSSVFSRGPLFVGRVKFTPRIGPSTANNNKIRIIITPLFYFTCQPPCDLSRNLHVKPEATVRVASRQKSPVIAPER